jgi:hypothetical protein
MNLRGFRMKRYLNELIEALNMMNFKREALSVNEIFKKISSDGSKEHTDDEYDFSDLEQIKELYDSKRYNFKRNDRAGRESYDLTLSGTDEWPEAYTYYRDPVTNELVKRRGFRWNPEIADIYEDENDSYITSNTRIKEGWLSELPEDKSLIYRGISSEEFNFINNKGYIESIGGYNIGDEQVGLTYFSTDPSAATHYANGFAPPQYKATPDKPVYVIAISARDGIKLPGTGEHEIGVRGRIDKSEIKAIWVGKPYHTNIGGNIDIIDDWNGRRPGSRYMPAIHIAWKRIK